MSIRVFRAGQPPSVGPSGEGRTGDRRSEDRRSGGPRSDPPFNGRGGFARRPQDEGQAQGGGFRSDRRTDWDEDRRPRHKFAEERRDRDDDRRAGPPSEATQRALAVLRAAAGESVALENTIAPATQRFEPQRELAPHATESGERLNKRMATLGLASRREADEWIDRGWVLVNGQVARMGQRVQESDTITVTDDAKNAQAELVTFLLHKPVGWVSGQPEDGHPAAIELISESTQNVSAGRQKAFKPWHLKHLAPCGRLDIDSTGLLVLTQDGRIARSIIGEDSDMEKEYLVRVEYQGAPEIGVRAPVEPGSEEHLYPTQGEAVSAIKKNVKAVFPPEGIERLRHGLELDGQALLPAKVSWQNEEQLRFVLREGKKRQIRRMCEAVGLKVVGLKRIRIGRVVLGELPVGKWRYLQDWEKF